MVPRTTGIFCMSAGPAGECGTNTSLWISSGNQLWSRWHKSRAVFIHIVYVCASYARYRVLIMLPILSLITVEICCLNEVSSLHDHRFLTRSGLIYNSLTSQHVCYFWSDGAILTAEDELALVSGFLGSSAFHHHLSSLSYPSYYEEHESGKEWFDI